MANNFVASFVVALFMSAVAADLIKLADEPVNLNYTDVQSVYSDGFYVMLYVGAAGSNGFYRYYIELYQLIDGTRLENRSLTGQRHLSVKSKNANLSLAVDPISGNSVLTIYVCSSTQCGEVLINTQLLSVAFGRVKNWCHSKILVGDILRASTAQGTRTAAVISREMNLFGYICLPGGTERSVQLVCTDESGAFTRIHSVETDVISNKFNVFALVSNDQKTTLCTFNIDIDELSATSSNTILPKNPSSKLVFTDSPVAVAVSTAGKDHIAFLSSSDGKISKVYIKSDAAYKINEFVVTPPVVNPFPKLLLKEDKLLLMSSTRILLLDVEQTCEQHTDLCSCRAPRDPKCGWCVVSSKCTMSLECEGIWMKADPSSRTVCWNATVTPLSVSRANPEPLNISVGGDMGADKFGRAISYKCIFGSRNITTTAISTSDQSLTCSPPDHTELDQIPDGTQDLPVLIYYSIQENYLPLIVNYKLVICEDIDSCDKCTNSHNTCTWCVNDHKCAHVATADAACLRSSGNKDKRPFGSSGNCPAINVTNVRAPVNENFTLTLPVTGFPTVVLKYSCLVKTETTQKILPATRAGDNIICSPHKYGNSSNSQSFLSNSFTVSVLMGEDNWKLAKAEGMVYNCSHHVACTQCLQDVRTTDCVWCKGSTQCLYKQCPNLDQKINGICPSLTIFKRMVKPTSIPLEGGLTLRIPGQGLNVGDGYKTVKVDLENVPCRNVNISSESEDGRAMDVLYCVTPRMERRQLASLKIVLNGISWQEPSFINYYNPTMTNLHVYEKRNDSHGPLAGGTEILISGADLAQLMNIDYDVLFVISPLSSSTPLRLQNCSSDNSAIRCFTPPVTKLAKYSAKLVFTEKQYTRDMTTNKLFEYRPNSKIEGIEPDAMIKWGGKEFVVNGTNLNSVSNPKVRFTGLDDEYPCTVISSVQLSCTYPEFSTSGPHKVVLLMDGIPTASTTLNLTVHPNPVFKHFAEEKDKTNELILDGKNIDAVDQDDIKVFVGEKECKIEKKESTTIICVPPELTNEEQENTDVTIHIYDVERFNLGSLNYATASTGLSDSVIGGIAGGGSAAVVIMVVVAILLFRRSRYHKQRYKSMVKHVDQLECNSRHEIKQAFAELQTDMSDLMSDLSATGIPYWDYKNFTFKILFPGQNDHPSLHKLMTKRKTAVMQALDMFEHLIYNKDFLVSFIHTLEEQPTFSMPDKVQLAALLMLTLQHKMDYATVVIKELLSELIDSSIKKRHPKLLLRRSESVVEKMLTHWLSLCLYKYLQDHAGTPLFMLYKAIKHQIEKGPVDALSGEARYSLSQERLLRLTVDTKPITLEVILETGDRVQCKVNDCDTTTQVKEKILDVIYKNQAYSIRPIAIDYNLEWHHGMVGVPICDEDLTSQTAGGWKRLNTLAHYSIPDNAIVKLVSRHHAHSLHSNRSRDREKLCDTLPNSKTGTPRGTLTRNGANLSTSNLQDHYVHSHISLWHLSKSAGSQTLPKDRQQTMMSEIFLTRLLKTKGTLQEFIDKLFQTIFCADNLPPTIKFLFDFLDQEAQKHGITDPEVVHVWKNNSLNLRFWVNIIKNPEFVFDVHKSEIVDASLSTIAQTFIDSCAMTESDFGVDAPINKLLFARDRPKYRKMLQSMYSDIRNKPTVPDHTLNAHLNELSKMYPREFYRNSALKEIYHFAQRYQTQIIQDLEDNFPKHRNPNLTTLLRDISATLDERQAPVRDYV